MIIGLGETLGMRTIAEGIQEAEQATALREMRCELGQGYYYSVPVAPEEFARRVVDGVLAAPAEAGTWTAPDQEAFENRATGVGSST
jgi:predicted signal transduction protein with EAL and GGDEF domain